jgi:transcription initiation factor IIE alpha subunit
MSEAEEGTTRQAIERLMDGQREALQVVRATLEGSGVPTEDALVNLQDILEGTLEDALSLLGEENEA